MAKRKKSKLPKRIAGIKIPKSVRKSSGSLAALLQTKIGREAAAAGLVAMAGSLLGSDAGRKAAGNVGHAAAGAGASTADVLGAVGKAAGSVVAEAARRVLPGSLTEERRDDPDREEPLRVAPVAEPDVKRPKDRDKLRNH